jgi:hypothetical protein
LLASEFVGEVGLPLDGVLAQHEGVDLELPRSFGYPVKKARTSTSCSVEMSTALLTGNPPLRPKEGNRRVVGIAYEGHPSTRLRMTRDTRQRHSRNCFATSCSWLGGGDPSVPTLTRADCRSCSWRWGPSVLVMTVPWIHHSHSEFSGQPTVVRAKC